jgi:hypothetical protein
VDTAGAHERYLQGCNFLEQRQVALAAREMDESLRLGLDPAIGVNERWTIHMLLGDFEAAWRETDRIEEQRRKGSSVTGALVWDGSDFFNRVVLLRSLHGLGDAIQFIRYAPLLRRRCRRLLVKAQPILLPLLRTFDCIDEVLERSAPDPTFEVQMECTELPYIFRTTMDTIPPEIPYVRLKNLASSVDSSIDDLAVGQLNVGLVWASGPWNKTRSMGLVDLSPLGTVSNVLFHSLQWGPDWREARSDQHGLPIRNSSQPIAEDLLETAAAIMRMDLVITVDTMVAHLAGALGKPVWVLLCFDSNWRWMLETGTSPWYAAMRLFRQTSRGDWSLPVQRIVEELATIKLR